MCKRKLHNNYCIFNQLIIPKLSFSSSKKMARGPVVNGLMPLKNQELFILIYPLKVTQIIIFGPKKDASNLI